MGLNGEEIRVILGMPTGSGRPVAGAARALWECASRRQNVEVMPVVQFGSALANNFNRLWAAALGDRGLTHFAMLHDDIVPADWWLDSLLDELTDHKADLMSAVVAIKDSQGLTSTAVGDPADRWDYRRLTMRELQTVPPTFGAEDLAGVVISEPFRSILLANTGCWVCDLRRPWWRLTAPDGGLKFHFTIDDRISWSESWQRYAVEFAPEDWNFSRLCHSVGAKVMATRQFTTAHVGASLWATDRVWGHRARDDEAIEYHATKPLATRV